MTVNISAQKALDFPHSMTVLAGLLTLTSWLTQLIQEALRAHNNQKGWGKMIRLRPKVTSRADPHVLVSQNSLTLVS